jgi:hypothetical protein
MGGLPRGLLLEIGFRAHTGYVAARLAGASQGPRRFSAGPARTGRPDIRAVARWRPNLVVAFAAILDKTQRADVVERVLRAMQTKELTATKAVLERLKTGCPTLPG